MNADLFNAMLSIITAVITIGGGVVINYLKKKINNEKLTTYYNLSKQVVMYVEQTNPDLLGSAKKELAVSKILELTNNKITKTQAETLIESAVYEIKKLINTSN